MKLTVNLKENSYPIYIENGILNRAGEYIADLFHGQRIMIVSDDNVFPLYGKQLCDSLSGYECHSLVLPHGEPTKSFDTLPKVYSAMLDAKLTRSDLVIALGGGVIGDLTGFAASTYLRGIKCVQIPTSLLAQVDSSVGGKTAVDLPQGKNLVGAFFHPKMVLIDPDVLATLPQRHINNGLAEALKAGLIRDESLFELFETDDPMEHIEKILYKSLMMKKKVVEIDEREIGVRRILNFGHTIGHGIESYYHLHDVYHGEAVALGMMKMIKDETIRERLHPIYQRLNLKEDIDYDRQQVYDFITKDKKIDGGTLTIVLLRKIGEAYLKDIPTEKIKEYL